MVLGTVIPIKTYMGFPWMIRRHRHDILDDFKIRIDSWAIVALNKTAISISHRAYGYRTAEPRNLVLLHAMGNFPMPQVTPKFF